jgi:putative tryptophan/tyrosine transport system substrate-binding protein
MATRRALIIGGSVGGLFAAHMLGRIGWEVDVFERASENLAGRGAGIGTHPALGEVMRRLGLAFDEVLHETSGVHFPSGRCCSVSVSAGGAGPKKRPRAADRGLLPFDDESDPQVRELWPVFTQRLRDLGWSEGHNIQFDLHFTGQDKGRINSGAVKLVASAPDLIVVWSNPAAAALKQATRTIPVIFAQVSDPVGEGVVDSLARPGGNITGFQNFETAIGGKWLQLLKEIAPTVRRVAVVYNQNIVANVAFLHAAEAASASLDIKVIAIDLHDAALMEDTLTAFAQELNGGLIITPNPVNTKSPELLPKLARQLRLPAIYPFRVFVVNGGLVSYGFDTIEQQRGVATYVDRVLKGEKATDLPVQAPTKYRLLINLKAAQALGLDVSLLLQQRADELIE